MSKKCEICERGGLTGHSRSHSNIATKRKQHLNLQSAIFNEKKVKACARCIKTLTKQGKV
ncbi:50S ribosomal protein L28 [Patescibacteria group bacterium]|nr:50S ribosomal protein L28 [Patescibacteria group bacterium]MBU0963792.1 50S ribosomal protein L28 [Patescibacteria group bacterium]